MGEQDSRAPASGNWLGDLLWLLTAGYGSEAEASDRVKNFCLLGYSCRAGDERMMAAREPICRRLALDPKRRLLRSLPDDFGRRTDRPCGAVPLQLVVRERRDDPFVIDAIEVRP